MELGEVGSVNGFVPEDPVNGEILLGGEGILISAFR